MKLQKNKINFVGVGASRSGSTWLSKCLSEHPEINFSTQKELHFFDKSENYSEGNSYLSKHFSDFNKEQRILGEFTPGYFTNNLVAEKILKYNRDMKIIAILRNPIERAYSEYLYNKAREYEKSKTFYEAITLGDLSERYLKRGKYAQNLSQFYKVFDRKNILILDYNRISNEPQKLLRDVFLFLDVNPSFLPDSAHTVLNTSNNGDNINYIPGLNRMINKLLTIEFQKDSKVRKIVKFAGIANLLRVIYKKNTNHFIHSSNSSIELENKDYVYLKNYYKHEAAELEELTGKRFFWF